MGWFRKPPPPADIWDLPEPRVADDIEAARQVRSICQAAMASADKNARFGKVEQADAYRYRAARGHLISLAAHMRDELLHDAAVRDILAFCMKANDVETAAALAAEIRTESFKRQLIKEHPYFAGYLRSDAAGPPRT